MPDTHRVNQWLVLAACVLLTGQLIGCQPKDPRDMRDPTLRVMSFNVRVSNLGDTIIGNGWLGRRGEVVKTIKTYDPDLLGTQEAKHSQVKHLDKKLKFYDVHGVGRDNGRKGGEFCAIYYRKTRFTPETSGHLWFNDSGQPGKRTWGSIFPRLASWVLLNDTVTGHRVLAINTHLEVLSSKSRARSAEMIRDLIEQLPDAYIVLTGDFNCDIGSEPFQILAGHQQQRLIDTYTAAGHKDGKKDGTHHNFMGGKGGKRIDWILVSPAVEVLDAAIVREKSLLREYPSDHFPVTASVLMPEPHQSTQ